MKKIAVLAIDDESGVHYSFKRLFPEDIILLSAMTGTEGIELARKKNPDVALVDMKLPDMSGIEVMEKIKKITPRTSIIILTAYATGKTTMEAMSKGAFDFITKPFDLPLLLGRIDEAASLARYKRGTVMMGAEPTGDDADTLVGISPAMSKVYKLVGRLAPTDETVLITGESGTGKELVARALVRLSRRADAPYLAINCAAFPETLLEAELFGYEKGAFTGASEKRIGKFEACNGGTILLDEIGDMPLPLQAKILRVLQEKEITRLGTTKPVKLDIRILAATHKNLLEESQKGRFRRDLFYRLTPAAIQIPPLRERKADIPDLIMHFVKKIWKEHRKMNEKIPKIDEKVMKKLISYSWPGNVRELENILRQAIFTSAGNVIKNIDIPETDSDKELSIEKIFDDYAKRGDGVIARIEEELIRIALERTGGNISKASKILGISRNTLKKKKL